MTNEERVLLIQGGEDRAENLERLYYDNMNLWDFAIKPFLPFGDIEELRQQAFLSMAEAVKYYKPERGAFSTFAVMIIRQDLPVYLSSCGNGFSIPANWHITQGKYIKLLKEGITDEKELAARLGVSVDSVKRLARRVVSLNSITETGEELGEFIASDEDVEGEAVERIGSEELRRDVWGEVERCVKGKKLEIVKALFVDGCSMVEVAERFGCSPQYISVVKLWALRRLEKSEKLRELARDFDYLNVFFFRGGLRNWKATGTSAVEKFVLEKEKLDKRRQRIILQYYQEEEKQKRINAEFERLMKMY